MSLARFVEGLSRPDDSEAWLYMRRGFVRGLVGFAVTVAIVGPFLLAVM